jgi:ATP-dependent DNA helicase RecG
VVSLTDRLDGVLGDKASKALDEFFGIRTVDDLLRHYPRKYSQGSKVLGEDDDPPEPGDHVTFVGEIESADVRWTSRGTRREYLVVTLVNRRPKVTATFFNAKFLKNQLVKGTRLMLSGEVGFYRGTMQLTHPGYLILNSPSGRLGGTKSLKTIAASTKDQTGEFDMSPFERDFFPIYASRAKLQSWDIYACVRQVLDVIDPIPEPLPETFVQQHDLMSEDAALRAIHLGENEIDRQRARERLTFDEAVGMQWALAKRRHSELAASGPPAPPRSDGLFAALSARLPFELTAGQQEVLGVLSAELGTTKPMNRLLQGEVGSGKTIVSVLAMLQMVDAGYQCALLAPTEVLAAQHARSIRDVLGPLAMAGQLGAEDGATRVALLTGSMSAAQKRQVRDEVATAAAGIVIGTHALLQDAVEFDRLGMVVVDEQHRFGVEQRDRLRAKAPEGLTPHLLVMTATPIPRTVALTVFGDLETSTLRELPRGRQPIATNTIFVNEKPQWLERAWQRVAEEVAAGRQAYVVASRIDESDKPPGEDQAGGVQSGGGQAVVPIPVITLFEQLHRGPLAGLRLGLMHGRLPAEEKDAVMTAFRAAEIDVLVCTTVIEVGVDVPNATVMVVIDADRFGISQLHQLRGRIGRGAHPSLCLLATRLPEDSKVGDRLKAVAATLDGFVLADLDLAERREGDVLGLNQSGRAGSLRFLSLAEHLDVILTARELCDSLYPGDPDNLGMALVARQFTGTDRIDYLDKA